jgi:plasmid stabilization system protein ParE
VSYRVVLQQRALDDLEEAYLWAAEQAPHTAGRWLNRFQATIESLSEHPQRCSRAKEDATVDLELRELLFGQRPNLFRVIFALDGSTVRVLRIRRAQRRYLTRREIDEANE